MNHRAIGWRHAASAVALLMVVASAPLRAQQQSGYRLDIEPGTDLRLVLRASPGESLRGRGIVIAGDTLLLTVKRGSSSRRLALAELSRLEIRGGKNRLRGATIGAGAVVILGALGAYADRNNPDVVSSAGETISSLVFGAVLGGLIGYGFAPAGWERLPLPRR